MKSYYLEGANIAWLNGLCLCLIFIGVVGVLAIFIIPDRINLRVDRSYIFLFSVLVAVFAFLMVFLFTKGSLTRDELEAGRHWKNDCKLLEVNIQTGSFTEPVNRINCAGVIINVPKVQYDEYIHQWGLYEKKNK
ncbi:hypothetical protein BIY27_12265 [Gibbsiella quercinecans]|uniref:hypothetical protein n=1 Tax=Gibbsiella quercinecans TaxID=929813 RepID=UPI000EF2026B|nr:hypothetical protein [Gibbsiella quercinecans]RLM11804.1 hypothetical protein BIY27_12265 [Gibbsiella quercinecans]